MNSFTRHHYFLGAMFRFLFCGCYLGCFRISEMLNLRWDDVAMKKNEKGDSICIRLRWHKKANAESECQIYHLLDEISHPCLHVCSMHNHYMKYVEKACPKLDSKSYVFPSCILSNSKTNHGKIKIDWHKAMDQKFVRDELKCIVEKNCELSSNISLHSMRRGGSFFVFLS